MDRQLLLYRQPMLYERVRVWREGVELFSGPTWSIRVKSGGIKWTDGNRKRRPRFSDCWEPYDELAKEGRGG